MGPRNSEKKRGVGVASRRTRVRLAAGRSGSIMSATVVGVVLLSSLAIVGFGGAPQSAVSSPVRAVASSAETGTSLLAQAESSLAAGEGPAGGAPMSCTPTGGGASCSTVTSDVSPAPASPYPPSPSFPHSRSPSSRYGASISLFLNNTSTLDWDILLFGGANSSGYVFNDTWQFNTRALTWWNVTPYLRCTSTTCPGPRHDAAATWDSVDDYVVLFGGCTIASPGWTQSVPGCDTSASHIKSDTWTFADPLGGVGAWTKLSPTTSPPARYAEGLAANCTYSGTGGCAGSAVLLFGGCGTTCPLGDTWAFAGGSWTNLGLVTHPSNRFGMAMSFAEGNASTATFLISLFGGCTSSAPGCSGGSASVNDTWLFYGGAWHQTIAAASCSPTLKCPSPRYYMGQTSYQGPSLPWWLLIYGGAGRGGIIFGNSTESGGGWWTFESTANPAAWTQWPSIPGYFSGSTSNLTGLPGWYGPYPLGPPVPRYDPMLVGNWYDGGLLFGGSSLSGSSIGDTWWAGNSPAVHSGLLWPPPVPSAQYGGSMVYDSQDQYDVLFGGCGPHCGNGTTWSYTANTWMPWQSFWPKVNASHSPPGRLNASMTYFNDTTVTPAEQVVLLFGGLASNGTLLNDTWYFKAGAWNPAPVTTGGGYRQPSPRQSAALAFNGSAGVNYAVLFGGCGSTCPLGDTWTLGWSGTAFTWTPQSPTTSPSARYGAAMTYDVRDGEILLFGGCGATCPIGETWTYTQAPSSNWVKCTASSCTGTKAPSARWGAAMTYDSADLFVVLFGGCGSTCPLGDTWTFVGGSWAKLTPATSPPARYDAPVANDTLGGYVLLVGGVGANGKVLGEPGWIFQGNNWKAETFSNPLPRAPVPAARYGASLAYNLTGQYVLMFGGCQDTKIAGCGPVTNSADTWEYANGGWMWICSNCGPSSRWDAALVFDVVDNYFLLVGGCRATSVTCTSATVLADEWKFGGGIWSPLPPPPFNPRGDASMTWDGRPGDNFVLLFGGLGCAGVCGDSWRYVGGVWTAVPVPGGLSPRFGAAIGYDANPVDQYVVMTEGEGAGASVLTDTWKYTFTTGWVQLLIAGPNAPRYDGAMTYDASDGYLLLVGGVAPGGAPLPDAWKFVAGAWTPLALSTTEGPRWGMGLVYDPSAGPDGFPLLFGGSNGTAFTITGVAVVGGTSPGQGDSWAYLGNPLPPAKPTWTEVSLYG